MNDVTVAAYDYAEAISQLERADEAGAPSSVLALMRREVEIQKANLLEQARVYHMRVYDGAEA